MREGNFSRDISYVNALDEQNELRNSVPLPVIRKFINSAVYVEAQATRMPSIKFNPLHFGDCPMDRPMSAKSYKVKTCVCSSDEESCPCHAFSLHRSSSVKFSSLSTKSSNDSGFATKPPSCTTVALQLSLTSINTNSIANTNGDEAKKRFAEWLSRKKEEQLRKELKEKHMKKKQEKEKQQRIERERENFIHWLNKKRKEEEMKKLQKLREEEAERAKRVNEEEIARERERGYRAWLRRKEQEALGTFGVQLICVGNCSLVFFRKKKRRKI